MPLDETALCGVDSPLGSDGSRGAWRSRRRHDRGHIRIGAFANESSRVLRRFAVNANALQRCVLFIVLLVVVVAYHNVDMCQEVLSLLRKFEVSRCTNMMMRKEIHQVMLQ